MADARREAWGGMVPMMVMVPEQLAAPPARLDALYEEAMARFDAFCFWYARPPRSPAGLREIAKRLEAYGSADALRIAAEVRAALAER